MRIRMRATLSGTHNGQLWPRRGEELDVRDSEGARLCASGLAEPVVVKAPVEKAVEPEPEKRADPTPAKPEPKQGLTTKTGPSKSAPAKAKGADPDVDF